jgi:hypothetical protein
VVSIATATPVALFPFFFALARGKLLFKVLQSHFDFVSVSKRLGRVAVLTGSRLTVTAVKFKKLGLTSLARLA